MPEVIVEGEYPLLERYETGIYSLDRALGGKTRQFGMPLRTIVEVSGRPHTGKSTLTYYLAGKVRPVGEILLVDVEGLDRGYVKGAVGASGFDGKVRIIDVVDKKGKMRTHEEMLSEGLNKLRNEPSVTSLVVDSVGAIMPVVEEQGDLGDANMGRQPKLVTQFARKATSYLVTRETPGMVFCTNHVHDVIGGHGHTTSGGVALKHLASVRMYVWTKEAIKSGDEVVGFLVAGVIEKLRYGGKGFEFQYIINLGSGVSPCMSAVFDCFSEGLATRGTTVKLGDVSFGRLRTLFQDDAKGEHRKFEPFFEALEERKHEYRMGAKDGQISGDEVGDTQGNEVEQYTDEVSDLDPA